MKNSWMMGVALLAAAAAVACSEGAPSGPQTDQEPAEITVNGPSLVVDVDGMMCADGCGSAVIGMLEKVGGVGEVQLDFPSRQVHCALSGGEETAAAVEEGIRAALADSRFEATAVARP